MNGAAKMMMIQQSRRNEGNQGARNEGGGYRNEGARNEGNYRTEGRSENRMENRMEGRAEYRMGQGEYYPPRDGEDTEMRRRRDSRGRYMEGENDMEMRGTYNGGDMPESRFRDRRGREHYDNGRFAPMRNEGGEGAQMRGEYEPESRRGRYAEAEESPEMRRAGMYALPSPHNLIGFMGSEMHAGKREMTEVMQGYAAGHAPFTHETAMEWARGLHNSDGSTGPKWSREQLKPYMQQVGYQGDDMTFYAVANAMYSDYAKVMKKYGLDRPEVYADLAKAWIEDKDAVPDKAGAYYKYIVAKR